MGVFLVGERGPELFRRRAADGYPNDEVFANGKALEK
jgi:hypothetical protein